MYSGISDVELGLVVRLAVLREVLEKISSGGNQWWIGSDPQDAVKRRYITVGHGYPGCQNPYNASYFRLPVLNRGVPYSGCNGLLLLFDSHTIIQEPVFDLDDFRRFFGPIQLELSNRLLS